MISIASSSCARTMLVNPVLHSARRPCRNILTVFSPTLRAFHSPSNPSSLLRQISRSTLSSSPASRSKLVTSLQSSFRRSYNNGYSHPAADTNAVFRQRLLYGAGIFGSTILATNLIFNRETREDGGLPAYERTFLNETFLHTGLGLGIIGVAARSLHASGWSVRLMMANPWLVMGVGLAASIGTAYGTLYTDPDNYIQKYALWAGFNLVQAATLSPLMFFNPAILARAGLYTAGMMGSIAFVGATAKQEKYLYLGAPLLAGAALVALSGLAPLVLPATAARSLAFSENVWLYGGLAVFGGFTLYDVQKILQHARLSHQGLIKKDTVNESVRLELDFINIFIRMAQILAMRSGNNRK